MDSYNSKYPLEYYEIGTPYMFYNSHLASVGKAASDDIVKKYSSVLKKTRNQKGDDYSCASRVVGVVVGKKTLNGVAPQPAIEVMFLAEVDGSDAYITENYIVASNGVAFDDQEQYATAGKITLSNLGGANTKVEKQGGFTVADGEEKTGGFTTVEPRHSNGGFTAADE